MVLYSDVSILKDRLEKVRALYETCDLNNKEEVNKLAEALAGVVALVQPSTPENEKVIGFKNMEK